MTDEELSGQLQVFFQTFGGASNTLDTAALTDCFAEVFLAGDAASVQPVPRPAFLQALPRRAAMFTEAGIGSTELRSIRHEQLDEHYVLVRTEWDAQRVDGGDPLPLSSSFLLHRAGSPQAHPEDAGDRWRIVAYLNHQGLPDVTAD